MKTMPSSSRRPRTRHVIAEGQQSVRAENQEAARTRDPLQLAEPRVLALLVKHAAAVHEVERAFR